MKFITIVLAAVLGLIGTDIYVPSLPTISHYFHQAPNHTELTISLFLVSYAFSQLIYGPLSDYLGRKPSLVVGVVIFVFGTILCCFSSSFFQFCSGRIIQGLGAGAGLSLSRVILRDLYNGIELSIKTSYLAVFIAATPAVAPFVGGILQTYIGFRGVFVFLALYASLLIYCLIVHFDETVTQKESSFSFFSIGKNYLTVFKNLAFMRYVITAGMAFSTIILYANIMPFIIQEQLKLSPAINGDIILFGALGLSIGALISARSVKKLTPEKLIHIGLVILTSSGLLLLLTARILGTHLLFLLPITFFSILSCGLIFPNALSVCFSKVKSHIGIAGAVYGFSQVMISMLVNFILNGITEQGQFLLGLFYVILGLMGLFAIRFYVTQPLATCAIRTKEIT